MKRVRKEEKRLTDEHRAQRRECEREQRERLKLFDRELYPYTGAVVWLAPGILSFVMLVLLAIPLQSIEIGERKSILFYEALMALWFSLSLLLPYEETRVGTFGQSNKRYMVRDVLRYHPISRKQYSLVRMEYVFRYVWKLTVIGLVVQCIGAWAFTGSIELSNIIYVILLLFVLPMLPVALTAVLAELGIL